MHYRVLMSQGIPAYSTVYIIHEEMKALEPLFIITTIFLIIQYGSTSYSTVVLYSRDQYEIIGLLKISHSIKQPCSSVCLKKSARNASKMFKQ